MIGIKRFGSYVPLYRLGPGTHGWRWSTTRAVANFDEDSITMAVAAARNCLIELDRSKVDGLIFTSTTPPYLEKQCAHIIAQALDLCDDIYCMDICNCLRSGTIALKVAIDTVKAGTARQVLVVAADKRQVLPASSLEPVIGDGAAAILISDSSVAAEVNINYETMNYEILGKWRTHDSAMVSSSEERLYRDEGELKIMPQVFGSLLKKCDLSPEDIDRIVLSSPTQKEYRRMMGKFGFEKNAKVQESLFSQIGNTGTAMSLMMLVDALESSNPGEKLVLLNYGNGADASCLTVTEELSRNTINRSLRRQLERGKVLEEYETYLRWRRLVEWGGGASRREPEAPSPACLYREQNKNLRLYGSKCKQCGSIYFPAQRVCIECHSHDNFEVYRFSDKKGKLFTYTLDYLTPTPIPPVSCGWADIEGGGKTQQIITDVDPNAVEVGMPVEFSFRNVSERKGIENYYWKFIPYVE